MASCIPVEAFPVPCKIRALNVAESACAIVEAELGTCFLPTDAFGICLNPDPVNDTIPVEPEDDEDISLQPDLLAQHWLFIRYGWPNQPDEMEAQAWLFISSSTSSPSDPSPDFDNGVI